MEGLVDPAAEVRQMGPRVVARVREPHAGHRTVEVRRHGLHGALVLHILHRILCFHGLPQLLAHLVHLPLTEEKAATARTAPDPRVRPLRVRQHQSAPTRQSAQSL